MKRLAQILRSLADRLDHKQGFEDINYRGESVTASTGGGVVVESDGINLWHPDQHGNVIEVEPDIIRKARRDGILSDM